MPPRKSIEASAAEDGTAKAAAGGLSVDDLGLPRSMIQRLAKGVLPPNTQIQKDALLAMQKSATVFVNYLASSANDRTVLSNKKTIQPKDVIDALADVEFEGFQARCQAELERYSMKNTTKRNDYRRRVRQEKEANGVDTTLNSTSSLNGDANAQLEGAITPHFVAGLSNDSPSRDRSPPPAKKARRSLNNEDSHMEGDDEDGDEDVLDENEEDEVEDDSGDDLEDESGDSQLDAEEGAEEEEEEENEELDEDPSREEAEEDSMSESD